MVRTTDGGASWEEIQGLEAGGIVGIALASGPEPGSWLYLAIRGRGVYRIEPAQSGIGREDIFQPLSFKLEQNYPNPFNSTTTISYRLAKSGNVRLTIFDIRGQQVGEIVSEFQPAGLHTASWNAKELASGIYFYRLQADPPADGFVQARKMVLLK